MDMEEANQCINTALEALQRNEIAAAEAAICRSTGYAQPLRDRQFLWALIKHAKGSLEETLTHLRLELTDFPDNVAAKELLASLEASQSQTGSSGKELLGQIEQAMAAKEWNRALTLLEQCGQIPRRKYLQGICLAQLGRYHQALAAYQEELKSCPGSSQAKRAIEAIVKATTPRIPLKIPPRTEGWKD